MSLKTILAWVFGFEILAMLFALLIFRVLEPKVIAAMWAGGVFVLLGLVLLLLGIINPLFRKTVTFPVALVHLFATSLPMLILRIIHYGEPFENVTIFGLQGPQFHHVSEVVYLVLLVATAFDRIKERAKNLALSRNGGSETN
jgi:hypothetical protein